MCDNAERLNRPRESKETFIKKPKKAVKEKKKRVKGTPKAPRKPKAPKTRCGGTMTEAAFFSFLRSALRQKSRRWAPIYQCLQAARRPSRNQNKRLKWEFQCSKCNGWFPQKEVSVDHIDPCGSLRSFEDLPAFARRLFVEKEGLRVLCNPCHQIITKTERERNDS